MKVLIAPDSFKGTMSNARVAQSIAEGWLSVRPGDEITLLPMADGGEGTLETISFNTPSALRIESQLGEGRFWLLLEDGTAVVELANICGITRTSPLDPLGASTFDLGVVLKEALDEPRVKKLIIAVGGSASTDGGAGALIALGAKFTDFSGKSISLGGVGLEALAAIDLREVPVPPIGGVRCLTDVTNPLLGEWGSARVFAPQKGASADQVATLERRLTQLKEISGVQDFAGAGAAGGTPFGLSLAWKVEIESGALVVGAVIGLVKAIQESDLVITGEGRLDTQSYRGKVVGVITSLAAGANKRTLYCVGSSEEPLKENGIALVDIAPSLEDAMKRPEEWVMKAGEKLANLVTADRSYHRPPLERFR